MKICPKCCNDLPLNNYNKNQRVCRSCQSDYYQSNKTQHLLNVKASKYRRRGSRYGITPEEYDAIKISNNGLCHICRVKVATEIDHDHITGKVRGHLCTGCNTGLGKLGDSVEGLKRALDYLMP